MERIKLDKKRIADDRAALRNLAEGRGKKLEESTSSTLPCRKGRPK